MARRHHAPQSAAGFAPRRFSAVGTTLLGLALLLPATGASQTPSEVPDDVFRAQLEAELVAPADLTSLDSWAAECMEILAGPNRDRALANGDCTEGPPDGGLETAAPEPGTMALIAVPALLLMLGVGRRRRPAHLAG